MTPATEGETPQLPDLDIQTIDLALPLDVRTLPAMERPLQVQVREPRLLTSPPWVRSLGKLVLDVSTQGWRFPTPPELNPLAEDQHEQRRPAPKHPAEPPETPAHGPTRLLPTRDTVLFKDRLLYLLQPPLENLFSGRQLDLPFKPFPYQMKGIAFLMPRDAALLADEMGLGKAQPLDAKILTPTGWKRMGDICVGDPVVNAAGGASHVIGVYPQGEKEVFRVEFSDGSATECCEDHLWLVNSPLRNWRGNAPRVLSLREIRHRLSHRNGNRQHFIPLVKEVQFAGQALPIAPYLLGLLLGDGGFSRHNVRFSTKDDELLKHLRQELPDGVRLTPVAGSACDWNLVGAHPGAENRVITALKQLDLMGRRSEAKFIPDVYKFASAPARIALLQGLLDTDGSIGDNGVLEYSSSSPRLIEDVLFLIRSLGGTARLHSRTTTYTHKGERRQGLPSHRLTVALPEPVNPFRLSRKATVWKPRTKYQPSRAITSVSSVGRKLTQCIAVDAPDHLYVTDDFIVTHNTMQSIVAMRLLFHGGFIHNALVVCPKPLVINWTRELRMWAPDLPFEVVGGDTEARRATWHVSNCPLKLVNYELLTRDVAFVTDEKVSFDLVVLDEAQRIKSRDSKTSQVVRSLRRKRSWAMSGTPIENKPEDLVNIFAFVDPERIPPETPSQRLPELTCDSILRRTKEDAAPDMPPRIYRDSHLELSQAQREAYDLAEREGVIRLNALNDTITVQHVFELVMRLKQICNFDPLTGQSAKLEQLLADMEEVANSNRKAIVFSQWVEPLEMLARALREFGPLLYHGKVPHGQRQAILDRFKSDPDRHVILMSYGTGSVGLNLQFTNYVFLFDRWWNPAVEDQAINRAHRLGQKDPVFVTRFVTQNTIEGRIAEILEKKRQLFQELIAQNGPPPTLGLTEAEVFGLFRIQARPRRAA